MAGVTDRPFRTLCKYFGAGHAVSEMMTADKTLRMTKKVFIVQTLTVNWLQFRHKLRVLTQSNWPRQHVIRWQMARRLSISIWDVRKKSVTSLPVQHFYKTKIWWRVFLDAVVAAVDVPVTLKTRLGFKWSRKYFARGQSSRTIRYCGLGVAWPHT